MLFLKLVDSPEKIAQDINKTIVKEMNSLMLNSRNKLKSILKEQTKIWIWEQPEIESLLHSNTPDSLNAQFGLPKDSGDSAIKAIVDSVVGSIQVNFTNLTADFKGGLDFYFQPQDFQNLLSLNVGHVITEKSTDLHWLNWLLTMGDTIIITGYTYSPQAGFGRSRGGTMKNNGMWRIDPKFSGTIENNFITRAFSNREKELTSILTGIFL